MILPDGRVYEGEWLGDEAVGQGVYHHTDGTKFEGLWAATPGNDGIITTPWGKTRNIKPEKISSKFSLIKIESENPVQHLPETEQDTIPSKTNVAKEQVKESAKHRSETGSAKYEGQYLEGKRHGQGKLTWADGSSYEGTFHEDKLNGHGVFTWADACQYTGYWQNNSMHGEGEYTWPTGSHFKGNYENGRKQGLGTFTKEGNEFIGYFENDLRHGQGAERFSDGSYKIGKWVRGRLVYFKHKDKEYNGHAHRIVSIEAICDEISQCKEITENPRYCKDITLPVEKVLNEK